MDRWFSGQVHLLYKHENLVHSYSCYVKPGCCYIYSCNLSTIGDGAGGLVGLLAANSVPLSVRDFVSKNNVE